MPGFRNNRRRYYRRGRYKPRRKVPRKTTIYSRKGAKAQARQIHTLSKTVDSLNDKMKEQFCHNYYCLAGSENVGQAGYAAPLIEPTQWVRTFQGTDLMDHCESCYLTNMKVRCWAQVELGTQVISCLCAIVSLKEPRAVQTYHRTGDMNGAKLVGNDAVNGEFTYSAPIGLAEGAAMWKINPDLFEIHDIHRFKVGDVPFTQPAVDYKAVSNIEDANKEFVLNARIGRTKLEQGYRQLGGGGWKTINHSTGVDRARQRYLLLFTNATDADTVAFRWNMDVKVTTLLQ